MSTKDLIDAVRKQGETLRPNVRDMAWDACADALDSLAADVAVLRGAHNALERRESENVAALGRNRLAPLDDRVTDLAARQDATEAWQAQCDQMLSDTIEEGIALRQRQDALETRVEVIDEMRTCRDHVWLRYHAPKDPALEAVVWCRECGIHEIETRVGKLEPQHRVLPPDIVALIRREMRPEDAERVLEWIGGDTSPDGFDAVAACRGGEPAPEPPAEDALVERCAKAAVIPWPDNPGWVSFSAGSAAKGILALLRAEGRLRGPLDDATRNGLVALRDELLARAEKAEAEAARWKREAETLHEAVKYERSWRECAIRQIDVALTKGRAEMTAFSPDWSEVAFRADALRAELEALRVKRTFKTRKVRDSDAEEAWDKIARDCIGFAGAGAALNTLGFRRVVTP